MVTVPPFGGLIIPANSVNDRDFARTTTVPSLSTVHVNGVPGFAFIAALIAAGTVVLFLASKDDLTVKPP